MLKSRLLFCSFLIGLIIIITGCKPQAAHEHQQATPVASPAKEQPADTAPAGLAELSVEDRQLAEKQRICPVSGDLLGAMGKPFKTSVKGQTVFLCCEGCEQELKDNPDKYLAKLKTP